MPLNYDTHYAEVEKADAPNVDGLFAGDAPAPATIDIAITVSGAALQQFVPLMRNPGDPGDPEADPPVFPGASDGTYVPWVAGNPIAAITAYDIAVGSSRAAVYVAGCFNLDAIRWPTNTTEAQVQAAASNMLVFRKLLWSDKRTGTEPAPGTPAGP